MEMIKIKLLNKAIIRHGGINKITPCAGLKTFDDCFRVYQDELQFWYNDETGSTRMIRRKI